MVDLSRSYNSPVLCSPICRWSVLAPPGVRLSDPVLLAKLGEIAAVFNAPVVVSSGDRRSVVNGNSDSLHLRGRAVDFRVEGFSLAEAFERLRRSGLLDRGWEVIYHTEETVSPHLHLGRRDNQKAPSKFIIDRGGILPPKGG